MTWCCGKILRLEINIWGSWIQGFGIQNPRSFLLAHLLLILGSRVGNHSHKALLKAPYTLYMAINISYGDDDDDHGDNGNCIGACVNALEAERKKTGMVLGLTDLTAWCGRWAIIT